MNEGYAAVMRPDGAGVWERTHRGVLQITGRDRLTFLQGMVSNDVASLTPGRSCRAALLDPTAHLLALLTVHAREDRLLVETDAAALPRLQETLDRYLIMEKAEMADVSSAWAILTVQGGGAGAFSAGLPESGFAVPSRHSAPGGFDLWRPASDFPAALAALTEAGAVPVDEAAVEALRVEAGVPAWGRELTEGLLLPEADLPDVISYTKGCYVGQEIVARLDARGHVNRKLRRVLFDDGQPVPAPGDALRAEDGREAGRVTSAVASSAHTGRPLALAFVRREFFEPGTRLAGAAVLG